MATLNYHFFSVTNQPLTLHGNWLGAELPRRQSIAADGAVAPQVRTLGAQTTMLAGDTSWDPAPVSRPSSCAEPDAPTQPIFSTTTVFHTLYTPNDPRPQPEVPG